MHGTRVSTLVEVRVEDGMSMAKNEIVLKFAVDDDRHGKWGRDLLRLALI
jgi:hypothetical protein